MLRAGKEVTMSRPQQPEIARSKDKGSTDLDSFEHNAEETNPMDPEPYGKVPEANRPGHRPEKDQDKPQRPPG